MIKKINYEVHLPAIVCTVMAKDENNALKKAFNDSRNVFLTLQKQGKIFKTVVSGEE